MHTCSLYMTGSAWWAATVMGTLMAKRGRWWDPEVSKPKPEAWIDAVIDVGIWITWQNLKPGTKTCHFKWILHYLPIKTVIKTVRMMLMTSFVPFDFSSFKAGFHPGSWSIRISFTRTNECNSQGSHYVRFRGSTQVRLQALVCQRR